MVKFAGVSVTGSFAERYLSLGPFPGGGVLAGMWWNFQGSSTSLIMVVSPVVVGCSEATAEVHARGVALFEGGFGQPVNGQPGWYGRNQTFAMDRYRVGLRYRVRSGSVWVLIGLGARGNSSVATGGFAVAWVDDRRVRGGGVR